MSPVDEHSVATPAATPTTTTTSHAGLDAVDDDDASDDRTAASNRRRTTIDRQRRRPSTTNVQVYINGQPIDTERTRPRPSDRRSNDSVDLSKSFSRR